MVCVKTFVLSVSPLNNFKRSKGDKMVGKKLLNLLEIEDLMTANTVNLEHYVYDGFSEKRQKYLFHRRRK